MENESTEPFHVERRLIQPRHQRTDGPQKTTRIAPMVMDFLVYPANEHENNALPRPAQPSYTHLLTWLGGGALVLLVLGTILWSQRIRTPPERVAYHPAPLTSDPGEKGPPVFSPDGNKVAFTWMGPQGDNADIYVKLVHSETPFRLTNDAAYEHAPAWSPDGSRIAFMRRDQQGCSIHLVPSQGGPSRKLASCGANRYGDLTWSPDGRWVAFNDRTSPEEAFSMVLLSPTTLEKRTLTVPPRDTWGDHDPAFSPDGRFLSFTRSVTDGMQDVYVVPVTGGETTRLTFDSRNIFGHTWTPDGKHILFSSNRTGRTGLWRIAATGGTPTWVGLGDGQVFFPRASAQNHRLAYLHRSSEANIWRLSVDQDSTSVPLIASTRWDSHPQFSPDGKKLAFTSNRSGKYEIWLSDQNGGNSIKLTSFGGPFTSTPRWSPDGRHLVFTSRPGSQADIYVIDAEGALPYQLTHEPSDDMAASWSQDGRWIYFSSNRSGTWQVWKLPAQGGKAVPVTTQGGFGPVESPDGQMLYYARPDAPGLWRMPAAGGAETRILNDLDSRDWGNWAVHNQGIYYVRRGQPTTLAFHDFATGTTTTLFTPPRSIPGMDPAFAVSPDGRWILYGQVDRSESDLMLVEDFR
ncbi:MAG: DPP IV N-terminal domain-containing protein [Rhodothermales bacterium]